MILVYSTDRTEDTYEWRSSKLRSKSVAMPHVKKLLKWVKKYERFGAYAEVEETSKDCYKVDIFCPKIYVDKLGNLAIKPRALLRSP